jgi:hypothetical protein
VRGVGERWDGRRVVAVDFCCGPTATATKTMTMTRVRHRDPSQSGAKADAAVVSLSSILPRAEPTALPPAMIMS